MGETREWGEWAESIEQWRAHIEAFPLLTRIAEERVFAFGLIKDGRFMIRERCDDHFEVCLTADEVRALAAELVRYVTPEQPDHDSAP